MFVRIRNFNSKRNASKSGQRTFIGSSLATIALSVFIMLGGLYLLQRRRAGLSKSKNIYFQEYEEPKLNFENKNNEFFVLGKIHERCGGYESDRDNQSSRSYSKICGSVRFEYCFSRALKNNSDNSPSPGPYYEDVFQCNKLLPSTKNIFFLETSCAHSTPRTPTGLKLTPKQACSVYSAAYHNPHRKVVLLFTCALAPEFYSLTNNWVKNLWTLPNFYFGHVQLEDIYANTSLLEFYHVVQTYSEYPVVHQSDILRLFVLYVYGGTYMDLDAISLRSLDDLGANFIGFERSDSVNNAVMNFEPRHRFLELAFSKAVMSYSPNQWTTIGPSMITKMIRNCNISAHFDADSSLHLTSCNITVLPVKVFYAVTGGNWSYFYDEALWPQFEEFLNESYVTHYWNHLGSYPLIIGSNQPLIKLAEKHCTGVYRVSGKILLR